MTALKSIFNLIDDQYLFDLRIVKRGTGIFAIELFGLNKNRYMTIADSWTNFHAPELQRNYLAIKSLAYRLLERMEYVDFWYRAPLNIRYGDYL